MNATKTLAIERPAKIGEFRHYMEFITEGGKNMAQMTPGEIQRCYESTAHSLVTDTKRCVEDGGLALLDLLQYFKTGARVVVDSQLSRDLECSVAVGSIRDLIWPSDPLLFTFQDAELPEALALKVRYTTRAEICFTLYVMSSHEDRRFRAIEVNDGIWSDVISGDALANGDLVESIDRGSGGGEFDQGDREVVIYMASLVAKVLAYASIPQHVTVKLTTRAEKKKAGIHPRHQTSAPTLLLRHLPRVIKDTDMTPATGSIGDAHRFMGRAGHLRHYQAERYKAMKGQWQWIPPIPPPEGIKVVYKVRKVAV